MAGGGGGGGGDVVGAFEPSGSWRHRTAASSEREEDPAARDGGAEEADVSTGGEGRLRRGGSVQTTTQTVTQTRRQRQIDDAPFVAAGQFAWWDRKKTASSPELSTRRDASDPKSGGGDGGDGPARPPTRPSDGWADFAARHGLPTSEVVDPSYDGPVNKRGFPKVRGEKTPHEAIAINRRLAHARSPADVLRVVAESGNVFDRVNVATAMSALGKMAVRADQDAKARSRYASHPMNRNRSKQLARANRAATAAAQFGKNLSADERYATLVVTLVDRHCGSFRALELVNVLHGLANLEAVAGAESRVNEALAEKLAGAVEATAEEMEAKHVALAYNALGNHRSASLRRVAKAMTADDWVALAGAARERCGEMEPQGVALTLAALSNVDAAAAAVSKNGWSKLCAALANKAPHTSAQGLAMCYHAVAKTDQLQRHMSPRGWAKMAEGAEFAAARMGAQHVSLTFNALAKLHDARAAVRPSTWVALVRAAEREAALMTAKNVATVLHGVALTKDAQTAMSTRAGAWAALVAALEAKADRLDIDDVKRVFNAVGCVAAAREAMATSTTATMRLAAAVEREVAPRVSKRDGLQTSIAATLHALLTADQGAPGDVARVVTTLNPNALAITLNAVGKLDVDRFHADQAALTASGWDTVFAEALETAASGMSAHGVTMTLSALRRLTCVERAMHERGEGGIGELARATGSAAAAMTTHELASTVEALSTLKRLERAMPPEAWRAIAARAGETAREMRPMQIVSLLDGVSKLPALAVELSSEAFEALEAGAARAGATPLAPVRRETLNHACRVLGFPVPPAGERLGETNPRGRGVGEVEEGLELS